MSCNIRFQNPNDGDNDWPYRKDFVADILKKRAPDIFGTQEGLKNQLLSLNNLLSEYEMVVSHREWINERMYPTIFIKKDRFQIRKSGDVWLSETPDLPGSSSFDSAFPRLCTYVEVEDSYRNNERLVFINCHLDHVLETTREKQITVLCEEILKIFKENSNFLLVGDFNSPPNESVRKKISEFLPKLNDPWLDLQKPEECTFHKFDGKDPYGSKFRIDWTLHSSVFSAINTESITEHRNGQYPSDHFFIDTILQYKE